MSVLWSEGKTGVTIMIITLLKSERIFSYTLPEKVNGRYWVSDIDAQRKTRNLISIEGVNNEWLLRGNKKVSIGNDNLVLKSGIFYNVRIVDEDENAFLFAEAINDSRKIYKKLVVEDGAEITIGRAADNTIRVDNEFVSSHHAKLVYFNGEWTISDFNSTNGTYVNDLRITTSQLCAGDIVFIMGFKLVIGSNFIAINNPDNTVTYDDNILHCFVSQNIEDDKECLNEQELENDYFYRSPRFKREITDLEIKIDPPPQAEKSESVPMALLIGPSVTMGIASLSTGVFTVINTISNGNSIMTALPTVIMSVSMLLGMMLWPVLTKKHEKKLAAKQERYRQMKYKEYLFSIKDQIVREIKNQSDILFENNVSIDECINRIVSKSENLWERVIGQDDFLKLRVGLGDIPFKGKIQYPEKKFSLETDNLQDDLYALLNEPKNLNKVPIIYSFSDSRVSGIISNKYSLSRDFVTSMVVRMIALHSYDELKLIFIVSEEEQEMWSAFKWIPHIWDNDKSIRFFATNLNEATEISAYLEKIYYQRSTAKNNKEQLKPYYLILNMNRMVGEKTDIINLVLKNEEKLGFGIINVEESINNLPKESSMVIEIDEQISKIYDKNDTSGKRIEFVPDLCSNKDILSITKAAANIHLDILNQAFALPNMLTFLEMFEVSKIEHLNPLMRWKENNPTVSLAAPVGVDTMGQLFTLDLHEKFQGPHGLVAGMTGSGKSEFIITYILSMAVNYHPDEVAFILIDYKGGGLTGAFEDSEKGIKLPHLAGTITNLDGAAVKRSLISIQSELRRRQFIFNEARKISNEGTMDIYKYQKLYRNKQVKEPVPHLFIISDEFAELKSQQPEFMEQLISAARIGRSLGVHLILATQKPSGVVDDQIWSNSRFRVCLKVQEKADSIDMIKRPDAAELSNTGRFYLQVGFNEFFALGQSAWCGAPYYESGEPLKDIDNSIKVIDNIGRVVKEVKPVKKNLSGEAKTKQIVAMVKYLSDLAREENISVRPLWLDAIPEYIYPDELIEKYKAMPSEAYYLNPVIGELDDPFNQSQEILTLPITEDGNTLVYGVSGSGKLTFITTMLHELIRTHSAEYLNIYIMDFGAETLKMFEKAPQVGGVVLSSERERIINLMKLLKAEMAERKKLFVEYGGDYVSYVKNSGNPYPNIVVVINNYSPFAEMYEECEEVVASVSREGSRYGIYFVVTATNTGSLRFRIVQNFKRIFVLQMNDKTDYSAILGPTEGTYPSPMKGRGIVKFEHTYEFQTARIAKNEEDSDVVKRLINKLNVNYCGTRAKPIPILPDRVDTEYLTSLEVSIDKLPIGINKRTLDCVYYNLRDNYVTFVLGQDMDDVSHVLQGFSEVLSERTDIKVVSIDAVNKYHEDAERTYEYHVNDLEAVIVGMFNEMVKRHKYHKEHGRIDDERIVYVINSMDKLKEHLSEDGKDKLNVLIEKGRLALNINFVIGDTGSAMSKVTFEAWYKNHCSNVSGIWVGDGSTDQYILKITKPTSELYQEMEKGFGLYISKGRYTLVKLVTSKHTEMEEE